MTKSEKRLKAEQELKECERAALDRAVAWWLSSTKENRTHLRMAIRDLVRARHADLRHKEMENDS